MRDFVPPKGVSALAAICGQLLVLGVVLAALVPAASVMTLEIVRDPQSAAVSQAGRADAEFSAYRRAMAKPSTVPTAAVDPIVHENQLTLPDGRAGAPDGALGRRSARPAGLASVARRGADTVVTSRPVPVTGYGLIGVTWGHGQDLAEDDISVQFRTRTAGKWTPWSAMTYHDEHGADPGSRESARTRPGTDEQVIGNVDAAQVRSTSSQVPADMSLAVVAPGKADQTAEETPALTPGVDSPVAGSGGAITSSTDADTTTDTTTDSDGIQASLAASAYTPRPQIYSRSQWGADESIRKKVLLYGEVHAGFVHHTASGNDYSRAEVPGILRSIYAYHVKSRGWNDIGYNYLIDRFGRIWEGRYGGIDRDVVGAHTEGYNSASFAASAIGNYDVTKPSAAMIQAYGALFGWKLSLHGITASSPRQWVESRNFRAVNGHRDAASTACPGRFLYAKLDRIRSLATAAQSSWSGRERAVDVTTDGFPDVVVRRASDDKVFVVPTGGMSGYQVGRALRSGTAASTRVLPTPDVTGDGTPDLVILAGDGSATVQTGDRSGRFTDSGSTSVFAGFDLVTAAGDLNGDGRADFVGRSRSTATLTLFAGNGKGGFAKRTGFGPAAPTLTRLAGVGDFNGDGKRDLVGGTRTKLWLFPGTDGNALAARKRVAGTWKNYSSVTGMGDFTGDRVADLLVRGRATGKGYVLPGRGDGTVGAPIGGYDRFVGLDDLYGAAQLTGGRFPDVVGRVGGSVRLFVNTDRVELRKPRYAGFAARGANLILNVGDWNRDGFGDLVLRVKGGALELRLGNGKGRFGAPVRLATGFGNVRMLAAVGDMTGDGFPDLMGQAPGSSMKIWPGRPNGGLGAGFTAHSAISAGAQIGVGRWDGDGAPDSLFRVGNKVAVYAGNGPGGFTSARSISGISIERMDWMIGISDIAGAGGHADVIARSKYTGNLYLLPGTAKGLGAPRLLGEGFGAYDLAG